MRELTTTRAEMAQAEQDADAAEERALNARSQDSEDREGLRREVRARGGRLPSGECAAPSQFCRPRTLNRSQL